MDSLHENELWASFLTYTLHRDRWEVNGIWNKEARIRTHRADRTDRTHRTYGEANPNLIPAHGGYRHLKSFQQAELKLVGVARASLDELLLDDQDLLRQRGLALWGKEHPTAHVIRRLACAKNRN